MTIINLPSGSSINFEDASKEQIEASLLLLQENEPDLFKEPEISEEDYIKSLSAEQAIAYGQERYGAGSTQEGEGEDVKITNAGEIESLAAQYDYAKADSDTGRADWISKRYGPDTFGQDKSGRFYLKLDSIDPELKARDNLEDSGTMYVNRPGGDFLGLFDFSDVVSGAGAYQGPLLATAAAAFATTGVGLPAAAAIMGLSAGAGKFFDEYVEESFLRNRQDQNGVEIWGDIGTEVLFGAGGEFVVGSALRGISKLVRGSGKPDATRIDQLIAEGVPKRRAKKIATQEARAVIRGDIKAGAAPSIYEATGKTIAGRLQAVHEGIFGNVSAAAKNRKYVSDLWESHIKGDLDEKTFKDLMQQNADDITRMIQNAMKDPDEAIRMADQHLRKTIQGEVDILLNAFSPGSKQSKDWQKAMGQTVRLWQQDSSVLYKNAEGLLGDIRFDRTPIQDKVKAILGSAEAEMGQITDAPLLKYIVNKEDDFSLTELNALRQTLSAQAKHPDLVGTTSDFQIKSLKDSLDTMFDQKAIQLSQNIAQGQPLAGGGFSARGAGGRFQSQEATGVIEAQREGLEKLIEANKHYTEGAEVFKTGSANMINKNIKDGFFEDLIDVAQTVVQNNRPELLKAHLARVTPSSSVIGEIQRVEAGVWQSAAQAARSGDIDGLNRILVENAIPDNVVLKPQAFLKDLSVDDLYRKRTMDQLADTLDQYADDSIARVGSLERRNVNRDMLAGSWLKNASAESMKGRMFNPGQFAQKFDDLGKETQDLLFGSQKASDLRQTLGDFYLVGTDKKDWSNIVLDHIANPDMKAAVSSLQNDLRVASEQSQDALFKAIRSGSIENADELIEASIKNPKLVDALRNRVGDEAFDAPAGLKDQAMQRIMLEAFPEGVTAEAVQSGSFGPAMAATIKKMNQRGSLSKILGQDVVDGLVDVSKTATRVGDASLKGKGGLAAAGYAAAFGLSMLANPIGTLTGAGGILLSARLMRNKTFLLWMTKPQIRARDAKIGIDIIADELQAAAILEGRTLSRNQAQNQAKNQMGDLPISAMEIKEALAREARASGLFIPIAEQLDSETRENVSQTLQPAVNAAAPIVQDIRRQAAPFAAQAQQAGTDFVNPIRQTMLDEMNPREQALRAVAGSQ